ncbi:MAG TPA: mechanosensitive ion channel family protein [Polyangia bacterium]
MDINAWVPESLRAAGPRGLYLWQWVAMPVIVLMAAAIGVILGRLSRWVVEALTRRTSARWDDQLLALISGPLCWLWGILSARGLVAFLDLPTKSAETLHKWLRTGTLLVIFWVIFQLVAAFGKSAENAAWAKARPSTRALVPLAVRIGKVAVAAIALVAVLADLGYPVASLVAGLGIGGLALALAGQKTVENLFGAFSIGLDQPFSVGDTITVDGTTGTVEAIGLRSTRIRTPDRTMITIPNGRLAEMKVESFAARDRIRLACTLALVYTTTSAQLRAIIAGVENVLRAEPKTHQDDVIVRLKGFASDWLEVEVHVLFLTTDYNEFGRIRQAMLLSFMEVVERAGSAFAFPTRTVHVVDEERRAAPAAPSIRPA